MKSYKLVNAYLLLLFLTVFNYHLKGQEVEVIKFQDLQKLINEPSGEIRVINFWATWCKPCVKELPFFEELHNNQREGIRVILISFDPVELLDTKVNAFLKKKNITANVKLLDEVDFNSFIDKVHPSWSGALPATILVNGNTGKKEFYEKEFTREELINVVNQISE